MSLPRDRQWQIMLLRLQRFPDGGSVSNMASFTNFSIFCSVFLVSVAAGLKSWVPNTDMNDKQNWNILDTPGKCDDITFRIVSGLSVFWSIGNLLISGLSLPWSGSLVLQNDLTISFSDKKKCERTRDIAYERDEWKGWLDPDNWKSDADGMWLPHAERIPCSGEDVKFPSGGRFAVELPIVMVPVGKVIYGGEEYDGEEWADFLNTDVGKSQFTSEKDVQQPWLHDVGCPGGRNCSCGEATYHFQSREYIPVATAVLHQAVCLFAKRKCKSLGCYSPVVPEGHCCGVCGAVIKVEDNTPDDGVLSRIRDEVRKMKIESGNDVQFYVGRTLDGNIQVAVLSETTPTASDALALAVLVKDRLTEKFGNVMSAKFSGLSISGYFFNNTSGIVFGTLFMVLLFFAAIYVVYVVLPEKNAITGEHPFRFARFKNALHESEEKLEIGTEEAMPRQESDGFQNPIFSASNEPTTSKMESQEDASTEPDLQGRQEYDNPTYHEMEKTRELNFFETETEEEDQIHQFSEIEL